MRRTAGVTASFNCGERDIFPYPPERSDLVEQAAVGVPFA